MKRRVSEKVQMFASHSPFPRRLHTGTTSVLGTDRTGGGGGGGQKSRPTNNPTGRTPRPPFLTWGTEWRLGSVGGLLVVRQETAPWPPSHFHPQPALAR